MSELFKPENQESIGIIMRMVVPGISNEVAAQLAAVELDNLRMVALSNPTILECDPITAVAAVRSSIRMGLSLDPNLKLVYVTTRNYKWGDTWRKKLEITPSVNGLIWMATQCGILQDFKRPTITNDKSNKVQSVTFEYKTGGEWKHVTKDMTYFERLMGFSAKQNKGTPNALYTSNNGSIDPEFAATKVMRHVLSKMGINPVIKRDVQIDFSPVIENMEAEDIINDSNLDL